MQERAGPLEGRPARSPEKEGNSKQRKPANMSIRDPLQATITERLDLAIERLIEQGLKPAAIYLTTRDRELLDKYATRMWRTSTGSTSYAYPCSYNDLPLIAEKLIEHYELPVRQRTGVSKLRSTVYSSTGQGVPLDLP